LDRTNSSSVDSSELPVQLQIIVLTATIN
jgi:hypothetical protein